jgi:hypothetical protein
MDDGYCHHLDVDLDAVLFVNRVAAAAISRTQTVVSLVVVDEVYHLVTGLALLVVDDGRNAAVVEVVFPDFHRLLNAPWQKTGETSVTEEANWCEKKFNPLVFFLWCMYRDCTKNLLYS